MSINLAFYLKYRPQSLDELVGQETVKKTLLLSFQNSKLSHAYLFVGPRGTGKTSTARILAKMINCESSPVIPSKEGIHTNNGSPIKSGMTGGIPCNKCPTCLSITDGSNLDLIEIDAASNRGIEDIRSLRDKIKLAPTSAKKKVYIIDEVHMLTPEAFNALLKTLEEPPAHALFILATTEVNKVPQTILSRVQKLEFKLAKPQEISEALLKIIKAEKIDIEEEAIKILVRQASGSFRDGVKLLDQVSSQGKITAKSLEESLKNPRFDNLLDLIKSLAEKDVSKGLLSVSKLLESGTDIKELMLSLMEVLRNLVFIKNGLGEVLVEPQFTEDKYEILMKISATSSGNDLINNLDLLQKAMEKLKVTSIPSLPLELAVVEICMPSSVILSEAKDLSTSLSPTFVGDSSSKTPQNDKKAIIDDRESKAVIEDSKENDSAQSIIEGSLSSDSPDIQKLKEKWTFVLETVRSINFSLEALLRSINVSDCTESSVIMEVPYSFHQRILEVPKNRDLLEGIFADILGRSVRISIILGSRPPRKDDIANIEVAEDDEIIRAAAEIFSSDTVN